jgi:hypothetical protein
MQVFVHKIIIQVAIRVTKADVGMIVKVRLYLWNSVACHTNSSSTVNRATSVGTATRSSSSNSAMIITSEIIPAKITKANRLGLLLIPACIAEEIIGTKIVGTRGNNPLVTSIVWISSSTTCRLLRLMYQRRLYVPTVLNTANRVSKIYAIRILAFDGLG